MKTIFTPAYRNLVEDLRQARLRRNMRQEDVGRRLGVSRHWIAKVEACQSRLDLVQFVRLCRVYHLAPSRLLRRLEEETPEEGDSSFSYQSPDFLPQGTSVYRNVSASSYPEFPGHLLATFLPQIVLFIKIGVF